MKLDNQKHLRAQPNLSWNYLFYTFQICLSFSGGFDKGNESRISKNYLIYLILLFFLILFTKILLTKKSTRSCFWALEERYKDL